MDELHSLLKKVDGSNQMLWKDNSSGAFQRMSFNVEWQFVVTGDEHEQGTAGYETSERLFMGILSLLISATMVLYQWFTCAAYR